MNGDSNPARPYPGLAPFADTDVDRALFFGRCSEVEALLHLVLSEPLTTLYSRSGLGKSSLINAGLMQRLRERSFIPVAARLGFSENGSAALGVIRTFIEGAERAGIRVSRSMKYGESLWSFFMFTQFFDSTGAAVRPVLILDQFEELFTKLRAQEQEEAFETEFADLVRGRVPEELRKRLEQRVESLQEDNTERQEAIRILYGGSVPDVKVLIALREDYLSELETLRQQIPTIFQTTFRLEPLSRDQARQAIEGPATQGDLLNEQNRFEFVAGTVDQILEFLTGDSRRKKKAAVLTVDPTQLQIVCDRLNRERIRAGRKTISPADLKGFRRMSSYLQQYYGATLRQFHRVKLFSRGQTRREFYRRPRKAVRQLCERGLMTPAGNRTTLVREVIVERYHLSDLEIQRLVDLRLLRTDWRLDSQYFELSHDAWIAPIRRYARWRIWEYASGAPRFLLMGFGCLTVMLLLLLVVGLAGLSWQNKIGYRKQLSDAPAERRSHLFRKIITELIDTERPLLTNLEIKSLNASNLRLHHVTLSDSTLHDAIFQKASLFDTTMQSAQVDNGNFEDASIVDTSLDHAHLERSTFYHATITKADFRKADIQSTSFIAANISRSDFTDADATNADFTQANISASFTGTVLRNARFVNAVIDESCDFSGAVVEGADFRQTSWWLARGWSPLQVRDLSIKFGPADLIRSSAYQFERTASDAYVADSQRSRSPSRLAQALNNRAWFRAIRGVELPSALNDVDEAIANDSIPVHWDTKGYILIQLGRCAEAAQIFQKIAEHHLMGEALSNKPQGVPELGRVGEVAYHIAVSCAYVNDSLCMNKWKGIADGQKYRPTYEQVLTPIDGRCPSGSK